MLKFNADTDVNINRKVWCEQTLILRVALVLLTIIGATQLPAEQKIFFYINFLRT